MEAQNSVGNIQRNIYGDLKVFTSTTYGLCFLEEYENTKRYQSHRSKSHFLAREN